MKTITIKLSQFIDVVKHEITLQEKLKEFKNKTDWFKNIGGGYSRIIDIQEEENILDSTITAEIWNIQQFTPAHSLAYNSLILNVEK